MSSIKFYIDGKATEVIGYKEYCDKHAAAIAIHSSVGDVFSNVCAVSDHLPVKEEFSVNGGPKITLVTWNVLNRKYLKHMQNVPSKDNQLLDDYVMAQMDDMLQDEREQKILKKLLEMKGVDIFCLQEVSNSLYEMIAHAFPEYDLNTSREGRDKEITNRNLTVLSKSKFAPVKLTHAFDMPGFIGGMDNFSLCDVDGKPLGFSILNAHFSWQNGVNYPEKLLKHDVGSDILLVCGDLNRGVRIHPEKPRSDHMHVYSEPRFAFPPFNPKEESATHVCHLSNCGGDKSLMLDRFDHVMAVYPPEVKPDVVKTDEEKMEEKK